MTSMFGPHCPAPGPGLRVQHLIQQIAAEQGEAARSRHRFGKRERVAAAGGQAERPAADRGRVDGAPGRCVVRAIRVPGSAVLAGHVGGGIGAVAHANLAVGVCQVPFDGVDAEYEFVGDLQVTVAEGQ
jgi:hypothetical protein